MPTTNFNVRGVSLEAMNHLKQEAKKQQTSVNVLMVGLIEQGAGCARQIKQHRYYDLDSLAGTWSPKDADEFRKNTAHFEKVDQGLWA